MTDDLRTRLRDSDPALGLDPLAPEEADRVLGLARSRPAPVRRMPGWLAPVAAAAVVALLTGGWVISHPSAVPAVPTPAAPSASVSTPTSADAATLVLTLPGFPSQAASPSRPPCCARLGWPSAARWCRRRRGRRRSRWRSGSPTRARLPW